MDRERFQARRGSPAWLPALAVLCFCGYLGWNGYWFWHRDLAPSILLGAFGVPAPTTGMTRALLALGEGEVALSLRWNPVTVPLAALYAGSLGVLAARWLRGRRVVLPGWMAWAWGGLLLGGWAAKLLGGPEWW